MKKYVVIPSDCERYIFINAWDIITHEIAVEFTTASFKLAIEKGGINNFFLDLRGARNLSAAVDKIIFSKGLPNLNNQIEFGNMKVSLLTDKEDHSHDIIKIVLKDSGINIKGFHVYDEALKFVTQNES